MLIYCTVITAILAFFCGFVLGYFIYPKSFEHKPQPACGVVLKRHLPKEYASFLEYDGSLKEEVNAR